MSAVPIQMVYFTAATRARTVGAVGGVGDVSEHIFEIILGCKNMEIIVTFAALHFQIVFNGPRRFRKCCAEMVK